MCRNGPVSSSRTGSTPKMRVYQASLTDRSVTVTATCEMAGKVPEMATMISYCSMWLLTPQRYAPLLPRSFPATPGPGRAREGSPGQQVSQNSRHGARRLELAGSAVDHAHPAAASDPSRQPG